MIDYIRANLWHEPGCQYKLPYYEMPCTCRHAKALEWLEAFQVWYDESAAESDAAVEAWETMIAAFARLEGE